MLVVDAAAWGSLYGSSEVSIELVLFTVEEVSSLCAFHGTYSTAGLQSRLEQLLQQLFHHYLSTEERISGLLAAAARCCHALSLFGTAPRARVRPKHLSPIDPVRHQHQTFIATECIPFPISGSRCRDAYLFLFQAIDAGHLVYITVLFPQH